MAKYYDSHRLQARKLRVVEHRTLPEICSILGVPNKSTVWYWVRDLPIPERSKEIQKEWQKVGTKVNAERWAAKRQQAYDSAKAEAFDVLSDLRLRDFVTLYIAEGAKAQNAVSICNMTPGVIQLSYYVMGELTGRSPKVVIIIRPGDDENSIASFWGGVLNISVDKIVLRRRKEEYNGKRFKPNYQGIAKLIVHDTQAASKLRGYMDYLLELWGRV